MTATIISVVLLTVAFIPLSDQQSGSYDPWIDYNEDGTIDVNDLSLLGQAYGSSGNPTKNVTIVKHASQLIRAATNVPILSAGIWTSDWIMHACNAFKP